MTRFFLCLLPFFFTFSTIYGQHIPTEFNKPWTAQWITGPGRPINGWTAALDETLKEYGVFKFRKNLQLATQPETFIVHVSGDNRYKLYVNGNLVSQGPARGDLYFWNYETVDLAPYLKAGQNIVAALVWNDGPAKPEAQISYLTGFILQGHTDKEEVLNTNDSWLTTEDKSYEPLPVRVTGYYVAGPGELVDMSQHISGWELQDFDDSSWSKARTMGTGVAKKFAVNSLGWMLVPSPIPQMEMTEERFASSRRATGVQVPANFPKQKSPIRVPANTKASILLDQGHLTNAYPTLVFSGGNDGQIKMSYAEGLYIVGDTDISGFRLPEMPKGNRDEIEGKVLLGKADSIISNGGQNQTYTPLWWRTYRYVQLDIETAGDPLVIEDIYGTFTGYPFVQNAKLQNTNPELQEIMDIGWRTARLCAFETYMDCPYYEQLQYIGDTRIQALVSYFNAGDDRLARYGLTLMDHSRIPEGITQSRYPTDLDQQIPTFSLWYVAMLHDYYMYRPDQEFIRKKLPGARQVLSFFSAYQQEDGSLKDVPYWLFTDWAQGEGWNFGMAPRGKNGESAILDIQLLWVYQLASELEESLGMQEYANRYSEQAEQLKKTIQSKYWDMGRKLYADTPERNTFSQHTNSLAILSGMVSGQEARELGQRMLDDKSLVPASIYFKYYLHQALVKAGMGNDYLNWLDKWRENIAMGLTTWAEDSEVSTARSDSHAWGSSPNIEFYRTVLGIDSAAPGFSSVKVVPHLGEIKEIGGSMPHPNGTITVAYKLGKTKLEATIELPEGTDGWFQWKGSRHALKAGVNKLNL